MKKPKTPLFVPLLWLLIAGLWGSFLWTDLGRAAGWLIFAAGAAVLSALAAAAVSTIQAIRAKISDN